MFFTSPQVGLEPTTNRLTADRSTTELLRIYYNFNKKKLICKFFLINACQSACMHAESMIKFHLHDSSFACRIRALLAIISSNIQY